MISVLIVDDELLVLETLTHYIQWHEFGVDAVYTAADGKKALEIIQSAKPDIIFSDIKMPHMNGIQLAQIVKESFPNIRFAILSGYADKEYLKEAIYLHLDAYIEKPINLEEISTMVRSLVTECQRNKEQAEHPGDYGSQDSALSKRAFTLTQASLQRIERILKDEGRQKAIQEILEFCDVVRNCEGSNPEYIRNVYGQLASLVQSTAEDCHIQAVSDACDRFFNEILRDTLVESFEPELIRLLELLYDERASTTLNPVKLVDDYIEKHFADNELTVEKIARDLNFNTSYLCTVYKQNTDTTINSALSNFRIEIACKLLQTDMKLQDIAFRVGYSSGKYLSRVFQKEKGVSPLVYRRIHRA